MAADWYVQVNGKASGPYTAEQLKQAAEAGKLQRTTQVWTGDKKTWVDAGRVKGLFPAAQHDEEPHHARMNSSKTPSHISDDDPDYVAIQGSDGDFLDEPTRRDRRSLGPDVEILDFLDFEFTQYATPILIKILWGIALLVAALAVIGLPIYALSNSEDGSDSSLAFVGTFFAAAIAAAIGLLVVRVVCEATIVAFKIASHIDKIQGMLAQHTTDRKK